MKRVERNEVLGLADYEQVRDPFRKRVIEEKKRRRLNVGPNASLVFENHDSVLVQIQEMLRTERITKESSIQHEIETYNQLIPGENELSATLMIEIDDKEKREAFLDSAKGFEATVSLVVNGEALPATWEKDREQATRASAVMYLKFPLSGAAAEVLRGIARDPKRANDTAVSVKVTHAVYPHEAALTASAIASIAEDLV